MQIAPGPQRLVPHDIQPGGRAGRAARRAGRRVGPANPEFCILMIRNQRFHAIIRTEEPSYTMTTAGGDPTMRNPKTK